MWEIPIDFLLVDDNPADARLLVLAHLATKRVLKCA
jgi:hypothetical protein